MAVSAPNSTPGADRGVRDLQAQFTTLQQQINTTPSGYGLNGTKFPTGIPAGSNVVRQLSDGAIGISVQGKTGLGEEVIVSNAIGRDYLAPQTGTGAPGTTEFPVADNYGWYQNTSNGRWYFALNVAGSIITQDMATLSGNLTGTQHGNLSAFVGNLHSFSQITSTLSDAQHGTRGGGNLHDNASSSSDGFMTATMVQQIETLTSTAGPAVDNVNATRYRINGSGVVGARQTGWSLTGTYTPITGLTFNTSAITAQQTADILYTLTQAMITHGLIGT